MFSPRVLLAHVSPLTQAADVLHQRICAAIEEAPSRNLRLAGFEPDNGFWDPDAEFQQPWPPVDEYDESPYDYIQLDLSPILAHLVTRDILTPSNMTALSIFLSSPIDTTDHTQENRTCIWVTRQRLTAPVTYKPEFSLLKSTAGHSIRDLLGA